MILADYLEVMRSILIHDIIKGYLLSSQGRVVL
jgi:hypothetical protein